MKKKQQEVVPAIRDGITVISIKSEIDSRVVLYPIMRCLAPFGSVLVVTSNKQVARLIDGEYDGDFRNFHILIDIDGGTDEVIENAGINPSEYTFVIYDNEGAVAQDKLIIPIGPIVSEAFETEMMYLGEDKNTHILRFGTPIKKKPIKPPKPAKPTEVQAVEDKPPMPKLDKKAQRELEAMTKAANKKAAKAGKPELTDEEIEDLARHKFMPKNVSVSDKLKKLPNMMFPKFEDIEMLESNKQFFNIDKNFIKFFYAIFSEYIGISEPNFMREVSRRDASSSSFSQRPADGENSIVTSSR